jgi:riboflavin biosynthesis pyrimidine reductase
MTGERDGKDRDQRERLAYTLIEHDLVDEVRLFIHPLALGAGWRLFGEVGEVSEIKPMRLVQAKSVGDSLALLTYQSG